MIRVLSDDIPHELPDIPLEVLGLFLLFLSPTSPSIISATIVSR